MRMDAKVIDPTRIELKKYTDEDRLVVVAGNREFGLPQYKIVVEESHNGAFHLLHGVPHSVRVTARDAQTNELAVSFYTRV